MTSDQPVTPNQPIDSATFTAQIQPLLTDLLYPSESDEPVELISCYLTQPEPLTVSQIKDWQMLPPSTFVDERPEEDFWKPVLTEQDWYGDEEKARTAKFQSLKRIVETSLTERQVFRAGESEIDVFLLGRLPSGERMGIKTMVVET
ncbi:nuclease A inhibitor family protein [Spirosoma sp. KUDC1026]|uniref:nuclease A inhibitor family protein n=1 Tax=Spirosoma sp. KUDC1026 TaxID=2745947 RepID=UPI00159BE0AC|nr:nuclease A inhibitor family protein [Spirosoma sp. KUDC1026]QKZ13791.1 nuclease A inhibitor family protein [Spirosoma sp. KUDC1026]